MSLSYHQASFSNRSLQYHVIAKFAFPKKDLDKIKDLAKKAFQKEEKTLSNNTYTSIPLRILTR